MKQKLNVLYQYYREPLLLVLFACSLLALRFAITQSLFLGFLFWNLFLAIIPYVITQVMTLNNWSNSSRWFQITLAVVWLLFLPNAPYIMTDLVHLHSGFAQLLWYDLFLVFVFAITGLLLGLLSILDVLSLLKGNLTLYSTWLSLIICLAMGYGIYLGRFLRFNSWDVLLNPIGLILQIVQSAQQPFTWAISFGFGLFFWLLLSLLQWVRQH